VTIRYTIDGALHTQRRHPDFRSRRADEISDLVQILLYADDIAVVCDSAAGLERLVTNLDRVTQAWHLDISQKKSEILSVDRFNSQP